jgi:protease I
MQGLILATDGFEDSEFSYPYYRLREAGFDVHVVTPAGEPVTGKHGYGFEADLSVEAYTPEEWAEAYDFAVVPGGDSPEALRTEAPAAADLLRAFDEAGNPIAAICHGLQLLISADVLDGRTVTGYWSLEVDAENAGATWVDEPVVVDDNLLTSRVPDDLPAFMGTFVSEFAGPEADAGWTEPATPTA